MFVTTVGEVPEHRSMVPLFVAGLDGEYAVTVDGVEGRFRTSIAPADLVCRVNGFGKRLAVMAIDPLLAPAMPASPTLCLEALDDLVEDFSPAAWARLCSAIGPGKTDAELPAELVEAVRLVKQSSEENVPGKAIASEVGFSLSHLQHLFRIHIGTSMRSYRTWCRFVTLASSTAAGRSLTEGASTAGFFDSAHLARAFNDAFGVPPSFCSGSEVRCHVVSASPEL
jgi:AraC-like DNA-binding protein